MTQNPSGALAELGPSVPSRGLLARDVREALFELNVALNRLRDPACPVEKALPAIDRACARLGFVRLAV